MILIFKVRQDQAFVLAGIVGDVHPQLEALIGLRGIAEGIPTAVIHGDKAALAHNVLRRNGRQRQRFGGVIDLGFVRLPGQRDIVVRFAGVSRNDRYVAHPFVQQTLLGHVAVKRRIVA